MRKHLLFLFRTLGTGGAQKVQAFVANSCVENGYKVTAITMSNEEATINLNSDINVLTLDYDNVANSSNILNKMQRKIMYMLNLRKLIKSINPDLIIVFLVDIVRLTVLSLRGLGYLILGSERADPSQFNKQKINKYTRALNQCSGIVYQLDQAASFYKLKPNIKQVVIPNPSITRINDSPVEITDGPFIFGAGRLVPQKRFDILIQAYRIVNIAYPEYKLRIYGDGVEKKKLRELSEELGLKDNVKFMGNVKDVFRYHNQDSIFVLSSDYEGIPNVITEALLNNIPCISTDCTPGGARFLLDNGKCGILVRRRDYEQLAKAIIYSIENPIIMKRKVNYSRVYFESFTSEIIEEKWLTMVNSLIENERR